MEESTFSYFCPFCLETTQWRDYEHEDPNFKNTSQCSHCNVIGTNWGRDCSCGQTSSYLFNLDACKLNSDLPETKDLKCYECRFSNLRKPGDFCHSFAGPDKFSKELCDLKYCHVC